MLVIRTGEGRWDRPANLAILVSTRSEGETLPQKYKVMAVLKDTIHGLPLVSVHAMAHRESWGGGGSRQCICGTLA